MKAVIKRILGLTALAVLCAACAQGGAGAGGGSISMYGTIDEGVSFTHK